MKNIREVTINHHMNLSITIRGYVTCEYTNLQQLLVVDPLEPMIIKTSTMLRHRSFIEKAMVS